MRKWGCASWLKELSIEPRKGFQFEGLRKLKRLTSGIYPIGHDCRQNREAQLDLGHRMCCKHRHKNESSCYFGAPIYNRRFYLPSNNIFICHPKCWVLLVECEYYHQNTKIHFWKSLHIRNEFLYHRHIQKSSHHWYSLRKNLVYRDMKSLI